MMDDSVILNGTIDHAGDAIPDKSDIPAGQLGAGSQLDDPMELEYYRNLVENTLVGVSCSRVNGEILYVNNAIVKMLEFESREELLAAGAFVRYKYPEQREEFVSLLKRDGRVDAFEVNILTKKGNERVQLFSMVLHGDIIYTTLVDITERKRAEDEVTRNQKFLQTITTEVQEVIFSLDANGIFTFSEGKGLEKLGLLPGQVVGLSAFEVYENFPEVVSSLKDALNGHAIKTQALQVGNLKFDTTYQPLFDEHGVVAGIVGLAIDVTEARQAEEALKMHAVRLQALLDLNELHHADLGQILDFVLDASQRMTGSLISFVGEVSADESVLTIHRWSEEVMEQCKMSDKGLEFRVEETGLLCECIRSHQSILVNNYSNETTGKKGIPMGHVKISRMLAVPAMIGGRVVSLITLANKPEEYTNDDVLGITSLLQKMLEIKKQQDMEKALREVNETLEQKVKERTRDLTRSKQLLDVTGNLARIGGWELNIATGQQEWTDMVYAIHEVGPDFNPTLESGINFYAPEALPLISEAVRLATTEGKAWDLELPFITAKQNRLWVRAIGRAFWDGNEITRIGGAFQDITEQKQTADELKVYRENLEVLVYDRTQKLETQNTLLEAIINSPSDIIIFSLDRNYCYTSFNDNHRKEMLKVWNARIVTGGCILDYLSIPEISALAKKSMDRAMNGEYFTEIQHQPGPGIYYEFSWNPVIHVSSIIGITVFIKDISERIQAEAELALSNVHLSQSNAEKDKFFSIIAHDLRSPFNSILGFSEQLVDRMKEGDYEDIEKFADIIVHSSKRAMDLLSNLMEWARTQTGRIEFNPEDIEMVTFIKENCHFFDAIAGQKSILIHSELPLISTVFADKAMISTVLRNLISNAIKFSWPGGKIEISLKVMDGEVLIAVRDSGVGIPNDRVGTLFHIDQSFSTMGTQKEQGTGLGLILCKEFVEKNGGKIWCESTVGAGTVFYFTLPGDIMPG